MGSGFPSSPQNDDWSCAAFLFFYSGCLAFWCFLPSYLRGRAFRVLSLLILRALYNYLPRRNLRKRDKMLLRAILRGGVWNGFLFGKAKKEDVPCRFCGKRNGDGHLFWECTSPPLPLPLQHVRELPEFASLTSLDRSKWTRCLLWHGWLPGLSGAGDSDPWASSFGDLAFRELRTVLGFLSC